MRKSRSLRSLKHLSTRKVERALADQGINCDHSSIASFDAGKTMLRERALVAYASLLDSSVDEILMREKQPVG